jgi:hypothetical protein
VRKTAIKKLARREIHDDPMLVEELTRNGASLSFWRGASKLPSLRIAILQVATGRIFAIRRPQDVSRVIKAMGFDLVDHQIIITLFARIAPGRRHPILAKTDFYGAPRPSGWHPPKLTSGALIFFCNNPNSGKIERITITPELRVETSRYAEGWKFFLR